MNPIDENLERLINRALDGELAEDTRLDLNRELIRQPEIREAMEFSQRIDALAADSLRSLLDRQDGPHLALPEMTRGHAGRKYHRAWWLMPGVAAAAVVVAMLLSSQPGRDSRPYASSPNGSARPGQGLQMPDWQPGNPVPVSYGPTQINRHVGRNLYGVVGTDGNIYLIETDHTRTVEQPGGQAQPRLVGGDL